MKLSIVIPAFNEQATIAEVIRRAQAVPLPCEREIIVVDDGSTDDTRKMVHRVDTFVHMRNNQGKGTAIQHGLRYVTGDYVCILDADLELAPEDIAVLVETMGVNDVVLSGVREGRSWPNRALSALRGMKDVCCGLKIVRTDVLRSLNLKQKGFGFECELTLALLSQGYTIVEVPVSYSPRKAGSKMTIRHALQAAWCFL